MEPMRDGKCAGSNREISRLIAGSYRRHKSAVLALFLVSVRVASGADSADPQRYLADIKALTTPAMEGRGDGSPGLTRAATLIEQRFRSLGLKPAGKNSYLPPFTVSPGAK